MNLKEKTPNNNVPNRLIIIEDNKVGIISF